MRKIFENSLIYTITGLVMKCFSIFLIPLYTAHLSTEDYGVVGIATSFNDTMIFIVACSIFAAAIRFYVDYKDDKEKLRRFYGTIVSFTLISGVVWLALLFLSRSLLENVIFAGVGFFPIILICSVNLIFFSQYTLFERIYRGQQRALKISIVSFCYFVISITLTIVFVAVLNWGAMGVVLASLLANIVTTLYFWIDALCSKTIKICLDVKILKSALKYSLPILPHNLSTRIAMLISKVLIGDVVSLASLGLYNLAAQFGNIADTIQTYVDQAYGPWLFEKLNADGNSDKRSIRKTTNLLCSFIGLFFLGISLFAHDYVVLFVEKAYIDAWKYIPFIVIVFSLKTPYYFYMEILLYYKKASRHLFIATLSGSLVNVLLSYFFIRSYGIVGSILADAIATIILVTIVVFLSKKLNDIGLRVFDFVGNSLIVSGFIVAGLSLSFIKYQYTFSITNLIFKVAILLLYCLFLIVRFRNVIGALIKLVKDKARNRKK